jgi:hypothetical protein
MVSVAQAKRITKEFEHHGRFHAIDSTTIDLCMSVFRWAKFRSTKSGIEIHTQIDIANRNTGLLQNQAMQMCMTPSPWTGFIYERNACYVFDRGYFDLSRYYAIEQAGAFFTNGKSFILIMKSRKVKTCLKGMTMSCGIKRLGSQARENRGNYPVPLRRIDSMPLTLDGLHLLHQQLLPQAKEIAHLYRYRWQVELFFKWFKQHLRVKSFWGESENAVRIQIHVAIITYCLVAIIEHDLKLDRPVVEVMRILGNSLLVKDPIQELLAHRANRDCDDNDCQLHLDFKLN